MPVSVPSSIDVRKNYAKIHKIVSIPNLIDIQKKSYENFLQIKCRPDERKDSGLQAVFKSVFPIKDFAETSSLEFVSYSLEIPKYNVDECRERGMTFAAPFKVTIRLVVWDTTEGTDTQVIRDVKEQEVYFGEIPLMTENGTFIINGTERVIVSQLHRSPGVFFDHDKGKTHSSGKLLYSARIIPYRGSWLDFEFDQKDILHVRIDRRRKMPATILLKALGYTTEELLNKFYKKETILLTREKIFKKFDPELLIAQRVAADIYHPELDEVVIPKNKKVTRRMVERIKAMGIEKLKITDEDVIEKVCAHDIVDLETGDIILECNESVTPEKLEELRRLGIGSFEVLFIDNINYSASLRDTLLSDKIANREEAIIEIYKRLRPGDPPTVETATNLFENLFFKPERYDLSRVGRVKLNLKLNLDASENLQTLRKEDILEVVNYLFELKNGRGAIDDIDHLGNRRIRAVGELVENQYRIGLVRMERAIKERMSLQEIDAMMPHDLINAKPVSAVIKEFFGSSQLSQFMDQTNPLSEITHKRRLSALGPGGLTRERAGFEVRDVHTTHYGRICPIETPEGPNIGLIASLSTYARVNEYGFIETPYRKVLNSQVTMEVVYLSALEEERYKIAQANAPIDDVGNFLNEMVSAHVGGDFTMIRKEDIELMDVSPNQLVSVAASLIPFLEHDDANRALMGSNMQRQAVPLMNTAAPLIGTGIEGVVAKDSGVTAVAKRSGIVENVDASRIVIRAEEFDGEERQVDIYNLVKYQRSNQNTCMNQKPIVTKGMKVNRGDVIADGPATEMGELALGQNVLVAFMPWGGYNFEDSILISEKVVRNDLFTSIHIEEYECIARDTKLGKEEITRDIPNVGEEALKDLDESGIIRIGAEVKPGDILVGKITPKGETQLSPEEKLLRAIFGEKAGDVRDTSLTVPPGVAGTIIGAKVFARKGVDKDERSRNIESQEEQKLDTDRRDEKRIITDTVLGKLKKLLIGKTVLETLYSDIGDPLISRNEVIDEKKLRSVPPEKWHRVVLDDMDILEKVEKIVNDYEDQMSAVDYIFDEKIGRLKKGDELPPGVIKMVKIYVAIKRKLAVGDKMAGRHGNKGVLSRILPEEDMPYLEDGTILDIVLNPLGVPSRMNVGQILETHLGWAAYGAGQKIDSWLKEHYAPDALRKKISDFYESESMKQTVLQCSDEEIRHVAHRLRRGLIIATPVFDGANEKQIRDALQQVDLPTTGQTILYDGRSGEPFAHDVTVGVMYMMKLHHLVDDKIHARSIGPYSLVTQQPLGGKAQFGGQRLGEMEVWALEAYGAAYGLQEFLTVKSDDVTGRTRMYEAIVKGQNLLEPGLPESFNVLIKELQSLGLNVELIETNPD